MLNQTFELIKDNFIVILSVTAAFSLSVIFLKKTCDFINENLYYENSVANNIELFNTQTEIIDISSKDSIIRFIAFNFLDVIFRLDENNIFIHYREIINNEAFFKLIKAVFSDKKVVLSSMQNMTDRFSRGELMSFFENLSICKTKDDFDAIYKNKRIIKHLIVSLKKIYNLN